MNEAIFAMDVALLSRQEDLTVPVSPQTLFFTEERFQWGFEPRLSCRTCNVVTERVALSVGQVVMGGPEHAHSADEVMGKTPLKPAYDPHFELVRHSPQSFAQQYMKARDGPFMGWTAIVEPLRDLKVSPFLDSSWRAATIAVKDIFATNSDGTVMKDGLIEDVRAIRSMPPTVGGFVPVICPTDVPVSRRLHFSRDADGKYSFS